MSPGGLLVFDLATQMLAACVVAYAIAVLIPSWRALLVATLVALVLTSAHSVRTWLFSPALDACSPACGAGNLIVAPLLLVARAGFMMGAIIRALTLLAQARGLPLRLTGAIRIAGAALAPAIIIFAPDLLVWPQWLIR